MSRLNTILGCVCAHAKTLTDGMELLKARYMVAVRGEEPASVVNLRLRLATHDALRKVLLQFGDSVTHEMNGIEEEIMYTREKSSWHADTTPTRLP